MLDFLKLLPQLNDLIDEENGRRERIARGLAAAQAVLRSSGMGADAIVQTLERARPPWLAGLPLEDPGQSFPPPPAPQDHAVLAVDGSQIPVDRHERALCYLVNVGTVVLRYGTQAFVGMESTPSLRFRDSDLFQEQDGDRLPVGDRRVAALRQQAELAALRGLIQETAREQLPAVALVDGTLILWALEGEDESVRGGVLQELRAAMAAGRQARLPIAGHISRTGGRDVVNTVAAMACGLDSAACGLRCTAASTQRADAPCAPVREASDALLFAGMPPGHRSALFASQSRVLAQYPPEDRVAFFYLHTGQEVARVEVPRWVADDPELTARVHALVWDQSRKGLGYPVALSEAHEQAVVRGADRAAFFHLIEGRFVRQRITATASRKAVSKRRRAV